MQHRQQLVDDVLVGSFGPEILLTLYQDLEAERARDVDLGRPRCAALVVEAGGDPFLGQVVERISVWAVEDDVQPLLIAQQGGLVNRPGRVVGRRLEPVVGGPPGRVADALCRGWGRAQQGENAVQHDLRVDGDVGGCRLDVDPTLHVGSCCQNCHWRNDLLVFVLVSK